MCLGGLVPPALRRPGFRLRHYLFLFRPLIQWACRAFYGILSALVVGLPVFVYGNIAGDNTVIVLSALFIVAINMAICWLFRKNNSRAPT